MPDPEHQGKHPYHDHRLIVTDDAVFDGETMEAGIIIARMSDCELQAEYAALFASAPYLLAALEVAQATIERIAPRHGPFSSADGTLSVIRAAIAKAKGAK